MSAHFDDDHCYGFWRCDECGRTLSTAATKVKPQLPSPWREVEIEEFVGVFHVCRDLCETRLRARCAGGRGR